MIEPAMFAVIRDGQTTLYCDPCGSVFFVRNLVWGPSDLEEWLRRRDPVELFDEETEAGAVIDFDAMALLWHSGEDSLGHPKQCGLVDRLIASAWPGYEILYATDGMEDIRVASGSCPGGSACDGMKEFDPAEEVGPLGDRCETIREAVGLDDDEEDDRAPFEGEGFAWVTMIDPQGAVHHRRLHELPLDIVNNEGSPIEGLMELPAIDVPAEESVTEAILFDLAEQQIHFWGNRATRALELPLRDQWPDWDVRYVEASGYESQCGNSGPSGIAYTDAKALGEIVPVLLFTERIDGAKMMGAIGKSIKGVAVKAVSLLTFVLCLPVIIFTLVSGNYKAGAITVAVIVGLVIAAFKALERKWKRGFTNAVDGSHLKPVAAGDPEDQVAAGPVDQVSRKKRLDQLLVTAAMPPIREIEPHFDRDVVELFG